MELFQRAKSIRLRSHHDKYLLADEDEEHVCQERSGSTKRARWTVEFVEGHPLIRLKSCYGKYLTASSEPFLLGMTGCKVLQTVPRRLDSSVEWEPIRDGMQVKLKTRYGNFLRANGGLPPWRNSVTHDIPHRHHDWVLWDVDVVEIRAVEPSAAEPENFSAVSSSESVSRLSKQESSSSYSGSPHKSEGRSIHYLIANDSGEIEDGSEYTFRFKGTSVQELTEKLMEETELSDIIVCSRNPLNGKLYPLRLQLPPNNTALHVVVVPSNSKLAQSFPKPQNLP
ncbi:uncharacterized protein LOC110116276 isoform X2 [Dendrobium catenatum]|uniref:uncharacterized protein LOC110116276 isoform X2 n=1 Tax=Dendrobium catenatum TaxID=906689 RepID=UPI0009F51962|nr:uncharacterized protein LOC110116276 isoform X2 [Dendrobium catenatum]